MSPSVPLVALLLSLAAPSPALAKEINPPSHPPIQEEADAEEAEALTEEEKEARKKEEEIQAKQQSYAAVSCTPEKYTALENRLSKLIRGTCGAQPLVFAEARKKITELVGRTFTAINALPASSDCPEGRKEVFESAIEGLKAIEVRMHAEAKRMRDLCHSDGLQAKAGLEAQLRVCHRNLTAVSRNQEISERIKQLQDGFEKEADAELRKEAEQYVKEEKNFRQELKDIGKCKIEERKSFFRRRPVY